MTLLASTNAADKVPWGKCARASIRPADTFPSSRARCNRRISRSRPLPCGIHLEAGSLERRDAVAERLPHVDMSREAKSLWLEDLGEALHKAPEELLDCSHVPCDAAPHVDGGTDDESDDGGELERVHRSSPVRRETLWM